MRGESRSWAEEQFGRADLGDTRRTARLVAMAAAACRQPSGKIAAVFGTDREREGAYDFLESKHVDPQEMVASVAAATVARCAALPYVFVPVDGTSISVADRARKRDFGNVGSDTRGSRGLKLVDALAVEPDGTIVGWLALTYWARAAERERVAPQSRKAKARPLEEKETSHWIKTVQSACTALDERGVRGWFQIDREGDGRDLLLALRATQHWWTVRANQDRSIELEDGDTSSLRAQMALCPIAGAYDLPVTARPGRKPRIARMVVRVGEVLLRLRDPQTKRITRFATQVVWAREEGTTPSKETTLDWLLYTNRDVDSLDAALKVIDGYSQRWRVEECHRTWKSGECDIEATQLESFAAVQRWSIVLGAIATRIERLKRLARRAPTTPADVELTPLEIRALKMLKFRAAPDDVIPSIEDVVAWLAELGGFSNKYSGRPPGTTVLGRGLQRLKPAAELLAIQRGCEE